MSDNPKFEVIDRRKYKAEEEERESAHAEPTEARVPASAPEPPTAEPPKSAGPRLVAQQSSEAEVGGDEQAGDQAADLAGDQPLPPPPTAEESFEQKSAYDASSQRLEDLVRAQNPGAGPQPPITFEHLVQQLYVSAMIQMGAGTAEGQRPRVDILAAKQTIDLLGILQEKTK